MQNSTTNWQDLKPRERMEYLLQSGHLSDCSFVVYDDGQKIVVNCHKFVLMNVSPVFERMFDGDFEEAVISDNIVLDDVSGTDFKRFVEYLYWADNRRLDTYDLSTVQTLIYLSKKFMVSFMTLNCIEVLKRRVARGLDSDVTIDLYEYAHKLEEEGLLNCIRINLCLHADVYINTPAVFDLSSDVFSKFIEEFQMCVSDKIRFDVIYRYCKIHGLVLNSNQSVTEPTLESYHNDDYLKISNKYKETSEEPSFIHKFLGLDKETEKLEIKEKVDENNSEVKDETSDTKPNDPKVDKSEREERIKEEYISKLLKNIKFTSMTPYDFCSGPGASELLTIEKKYELLSAICITEHKMSLLTKL